MSDDQFEFESDAEGSSARRIARFRALMDRTAEGDENAAAEVVRQYEPFIRRFVRFRLTDPRIRRLIDSVDISQSVFVRFFEGLRHGEIDVQDPEHLKALLATIARNRLIDRMRRTESELSGRAFEYADIESRFSRTTSPEEDPYRIACDHDLQECVSKKLPVQERRLLNRWLAGKIWAEIAGEFGGTREALRKRLTRSIATAARRLGLRNRDHE